MFTLIHVKHTPRGSEIPWTVPSKSMDYFALNRYGWFQACGWLSPI